MDDAAATMIGWPAVAGVKPDPYDIPYLYGDDAAVSGPGAEGKLIGGPWEVFIGDPREYFGYTYLYAHLFLGVLFTDHSPPVRPLIFFRLRQDQSPPLPGIEIFGCNRNGLRHLQGFSRGASRQAAVLDSRYATGI